MDPEQLGVVAFRLDAMEDTIKEVNSKLDQLLSNQQQYVTDVALVKQEQSQMRHRLKALEYRLEGLQDTSTDLKVGLAQKLGPGAVAGGIIAAIMMILKFVAGG